MPRSRGRTRRVRPGTLDIQWRIAKGEGFLRAAALCLRENELHAALSRAYYACYHVIAAVLEYKIGLSRSPWEHQTLLSDFRQNFTSKSFLFNNTDADDLEKLMSLRFVADYEETVINPRTAVRALERAKRLFNKVREEMR